MGGCSLGRYNHIPRIRVQKAENVNKALEFIRSRGVILTNIGPEDIIDGNLKLILVRKGDWVSDDLAWRIPDGELLRA